MGLGPSRSEQFVPPQDADLDPDVRKHLRVVGFVNDNFIRFTPLWLIRKIYDLAGANDRVPSSTAKIAERDIEIPSADPKHKMLCRLYMKEELLAPGTPRPLLFFMHGGGWSIGSITSHQSTCRFFAETTGFRVLSVAYRLAPEHPYPAGDNDCFAAYRWVATYPEALHLDRACPKIVVCGDSAGGQLTYSVAKRVRDHNRRVQAAAGISASAAAAAEPGPSLMVPTLLVPFYPAVDRLPAQPYPSALKYSHGYELTRELGEIFEGLTLGPAAGRGVHADDPYLNPIKGDLTGLPPSVTVTAEFDILRDEGVAMASALAAADGGAGRHAHLEARGQIHGFVTHLSFYPAAVRLMRDVAALMVAATTTVAPPPPLAVAVSRRQ